MMDAGGNSATLPQGLGEKKKERKGVKRMAANQTEASSHECGTVVVNIGLSDQFGSLLYVAARAQRQREKIGAARFF